MPPAVHQGESEDQLEADEGLLSHRGHADQQGVQGLELPRVQGGDLPIRRGRR